MSDIIPAGITPRKKDPTELVIQSLSKVIESASDKDQVSVIEKSSQALQKATERFESLQKSIEDQTQMMKMGGATDAEIREYMKEVGPLLKDQTEKQFQALKSSQETLERYVKETTFTNIEDQRTAKQMLENINSLGNFQEKDAAEKSKIMEKLGSSLNNAFDKSFNSFLGPLQLITSPLEELTGFSFGDTLKEGLGGLFGKKPRIAPQRNELLKHGIEGSAAVYLADRLGKAIGSVETEESGGGLLDSILTGAGIRGGANGLTSILSRVGSLAVIAGPAMAGLAAFTALKWDDITDSFSAFQDGRIGEGIETLLIGSRDRVTDENAASGIGRQAAAYGAAGLGIATTAGVASSVAAAGGLAAAGGIAGVAGMVGPALMAAFPPALIVAGVAATAKGIQTAWVLEWDRRAEESAESVRSVFSDEESNWWDKTKASVAYVGKGIFGSLAGGIRNVVEESELGDIWSDEEATFLQKVGRSTLDILHAPIRFLEGTLETAGEYIWNILPEGVQEGLIGMAEGVQERLSGVREALFGEDSRTAKELFNDFKGNISGFMGGIKDGIGDFFDDVHERGFRRAAGDAIRNAGENVGDFFRGAAEGISEFFNDVKEQGLAGTLEERINTAIGDADGFFADAGRSIANFFGDVQENGFGATLQDRVENIRAGIQDFFADAGQKISDFFSDVSDTISGVDEEGLTRADRSSRRESILSQIGGGTFGGLGDSEAFNQEVERYASEKGLSFSQARRQIQRDDEALLSIAERLGLDSSVPEREIGLNLDSFNALTPYASVEDAIIKPDGRIIRTSPDDTIVATKNTPQMVESGIDRGIDREVSREIRTSPDETIFATKNNPQMVESGIDREVSREIRGVTATPDYDYTTKFDDMIDLLGRLIDVTSNTSRGNIIQNMTKSSIDFNRLRLGES